MSIYLFNPGLMDIGIEEKVKECNVKPIRKFEGECLERQVDFMSRILGTKFKERIKDNLYQVPIDNIKCYDCDYNIKYGCDRYCDNYLGDIEGD